MLRIEEEDTHFSRLEKELQLAKERIEELASIIDNTYTEIFVTDAKGYTVLVNPACERLVGMPANRLVGKHVRELVEEGVFSPSSALKAIEEKQPVTMLQKLNSGKTTIVTAIPVFNKEGDLFRVVCNSRDITELNSLKEELEQKEKLMRRNQSELSYLRRKETQTDLVYRSSSLEKILELLAKVSEVDSTVLILGESGVGKEVLAKTLHRWSKRKDGPFIKINCGAIPENLLESELFGYEEGAFTGAKRDGKVGLIELAHTGTLFLDEIGELSLNLQVKLLHFIQEKKISRVGARKSFEVDVRIVAATNRDLKKMVQEGKFREDLYYRLNVVPIHVPPLRERKEDIIPLITHFMEKFCKAHNLKVTLSAQAIDILLKYNWPGNVRELENVIERLVVTAVNSVVEPDHLPDEIRHCIYHDESKVMVNDVIPLKTAKEELERQLIEIAFKRYKNTYTIAEKLGINQSTVVRKIQKHLK